MWCVVLVPFIVRNGMVMVLGSFFAASLGQCMAVSTSFSL